MADAFERYAGACAARWMRFGRALGVMVATSPPGSPRTIWHVGISCDGHAWYLAVVHDGVTSESAIPKPALDVLESFESR